MLELNKIYNEDCLEIMRRLPEESVDLIIADPPYFEVKGEFDFVFEGEESYLTFIEKTLKEYTRLLKPTGSLYMYCSQQMGAKIDLMLRKHLEIKNRIIWYRSGGVPPRKRYKLSHEPLFYCVKDMDNHTWNLDDIRIKSKYAKTDKRLNPKGKTPDDVWTIPNLVGRKKEKVDHPTQKPLEICDRIILGSSNEDDLVYIPFAGSGSEIVSCINNSRNYIASEISSEYIEEIIKPRLKD